MAFVAILAMVGGAVVGARYRSGVFAVSDLARYAASLVVVLAGGRKLDSLACAQGHGPAHRSIRPRGEIDGSKGPIVTVVSSSGPTGIAL